MYVKLVGKPKAIDAALWSRMQESWARAFPVDAQGVELSERAPEDDDADHPISDRVVDRLSGTSSTITLDMLIDLFVQGASRVQPADFDRALAGAIDLTARHFAMDKNPGLEPDRLRREMGGFVVTGYVVGRRLLDSHDSAFVYSRSSDVEANAARLFAWSITLDGSTVVPLLAPAVIEFVENYAVNQSEIGELAALSDRENAVALLVAALMEGLFLALGECELFG